MKHLFTVGPDYPVGRALYESVADYIATNQSGVVHFNQSSNNAYAQKNIINYNLMGDPELNAFTDLPQNISVPSVPAVAYRGGNVVLEVKVGSSLLAGGRIRVNSTGPGGSYYTSVPVENGVAVTVAEVESKL